MLIYQNYPKENETTNQHPNRPKTFKKNQSFVGNIVAGTQGIYEDPSEDANRVKEINECIKWLVSDGDLADVSERLHPECVYHSLSDIAMCPNNNVCKNCKRTSR